MISNTKLALASAMTAAVLATGFAIAQAPPAEDTELTEQQRLRAFSPGGSLTTGVELPAWSEGRNPLAAYSPVTDALLQNPSPNDWLSWRRTHDDLGFSPLSSIGKSNVGQLQLAWSLALPPGPNAATPLVHDGVIYVHAFGDHVQALDATTGNELWHYARQLPETARPTIKRNLALYGNKVYFGTSDVHVVALDAKTGAVVWDTPITEPGSGFGLSGGPLVARGKVMQGVNGQAPGGAYIVGLDAETGAEAWRFYSIARPGEPGGDSWGDVPDERRWHVGAWMMPSYDPELDLVYMGTSVTAPAPKFMLAGNDKQYLYHNSTLALRPATGETVWYYQHAVDHWDLDHPFERILVDVAVAPDPSEVPWINPRLRAGEQRRVMTGIPGKTGLVYTLDRATGEFLWARPTITQNVIASIDGATGNVTINEDTLFTGPDQTRFICPTTNGGKNWPAGAYSPRTKVMYFPMENTCMNTTSVASEAKPELVYAINNETVITPDAGGLVGTVRAIAVETGKSVWRFDQRAATTALVATGGDLVFGGDVAGRLRALDAQSGKVLWETDLGAQVTGHPITFAANGKQYVAVSTGRSNMTGALARLTPEVVPDDSPNKLFVFALPD